ncbi:MAG: hypothetical protein Pg6C_19090 [Treponemataceae bacterium]|nr:MAG: hypothetical protein Pg6C_18620 [Treponemataceae bacterium]GMO53024.1 MAG: hypothetical protein Pg6C_19090 [Treponemataceae bacterium]
MNHKITAAALLFACIGALCFAQTQERKRGIYFDIGLGFSFTRYGSELDDVIKQVRDDGFDRMAVALDSSIGWAVTQKLYAVGSFCGLGDRLTYESSEKTADYYVQINTYLFGLGIRWYPLPSGKYLQLGADAGFGRFIAVSNIPGMKTALSDWGFAQKLSIALDIDRTMTGPAILLGFEELLEFVEDDTAAGFSIFVKFVFK